MSEKEQGKQRLRRPDEGDGVGRRVRKADDSENRPAPDRRPDDAPKHDRRTHSA